MQRLYQGAEAVITKDGNIVNKERVKKGYRIEQIDTTLRKNRTRLEARLLREARRAGVITPQVLGEDTFSIRMEFIDGDKVKDVINNKNCKKIAGSIGHKVATLHNYSIIHGDLTTSNMIIRGDEIYFIDFGLGFFSQRIEDKATDLHLLREAIESTHFDVVDIMWKSVLDAYTKGSNDSEKVIKALSKIEKRGRYKER